MPWAFRPLPSLTTWKVLDFLKMPPLTTEVGVVRTFPLLSTRLDAVALTAELFLNSPGIGRVQRGDFQSRG